MERCSPDLPGDGIRIRGEETGYVRRRIRQSGEPLRVQDRSAGACLQQDYIDRSLGKLRYFAGLSGSVLLDSDPRGICHCQADRQARHKGSLQRQGIFHWSLYSGRNTQQLYHHRVSGAAQSLRRRGHRQYSPDHPDLYSTDQYSVDHCPDAAVSIFTLSNELGGDSVLAGNIIILSSALSVVTLIALITFWLSVLGMNG